MRTPDYSQSPESTYYTADRADASQRRKSLETVCHSKINHASTLHNEAVRRWLRVFGYSSGSLCRNHPQAPAYK